MKIVLASAFVASAAAFQPASQSRASSALMAEKPFSSELGVTAPLGLWDPLGLIADGQQEKFDRLREYEIKHGRVAMLAVVGYLTTVAGIRFPGAEGYSSGLKVLQELYDSADGMFVLNQMTAFFVVAEIVNRDATWIKDKPPAEFVGDYRNGALDFGWDKLDSATKFRKRTIELNNGRAAMMGIWGLVTHEMLGSSILPGGVLP